MERSGRWLACVCGALKTKATLTDHDTIIVQNILGVLSKGRGDHLLLYGCIHIWAEGIALC